jgi:hypothetical protein
MKSIRFTVRHGDTNKTIIGKGATLRDALADLQSTPLGSYAINPVDYPRMLSSAALFLQDLETTGKGAWGLGNYEVIPPAPVDLDALVSPLPIDGEPVQCVEMCISENVGPEGAFARLRFARSSDAVAFLMDNFTKDNLEGLNFEIANYYKR